MLYPALLRFAENQLRSRHLDHQQAEDLVQEACVSWFGSSQQLRTTAGMLAYLRLAITNRAIDWQRGDRQRIVSLDQLEED